MSWSQYPVGFWNYMHMDQFEEAMLKDWEQAGFSMIMSPTYSLNTVHKEKLELILKWCKEQNVKIILKDPRIDLTLVRHNAEDASQSILLPEYYEQQVKEAIEEFNQYQEIYAFFILDEPEWNVYEAVVEAARIVKKHSQRIVPFINLLPEYNQILPRIQFDSYSSYLNDVVEKTGTNLLSYDCYSQMEAGVYKHPNYFKNLSLYKACAFEHGIEFWNIILSNPCLAFRAPSYDDMRWQVNTSLAYGAKGLIFFVLYDPVRNWGNETNFRKAPINCWGERTQAYYDLRDVIRELHSRWGKLFLQLELKDVSHFPDKPVKEAERFTGSALVQDIRAGACSDPHIIVSEYQHTSEDGDYLFIVNANQLESVHVEITIKVFSKIQRYTVFGDYYDVTNFQKKGECGSFTLWLAPGQGELHRLV